jgi:DNA-directed RNA polymerase subunit RPC12/RpoP
MKEVLCPKCGIRMEFMAETESNSDGREVRYFYRCPACGTKINESIMKILKKDSAVIIKVLQ